MESQQGVIDFSLYLRMNNNKDHADFVSDEGSTASSSTNQQLHHPDITAVLDQKNYIEELNRHLK